MRSSRTRRPDLYCLPTGAFHNGETADARYLDPRFPKNRHPLSIYTGRQRNHRAYWRRLSRTERYPFRPSDLRYTVPAVEKNYADPRRKKRSRVFLRFSRTPIIFLGAAIRGSP